MKKFSKFSTQLFLLLFGFIFGNLFPGLSFHLEKFSELAYFDNVVNWFDGIMKDNFPELPSYLNPITHFIVDQESMGSYPPATLAGTEQTSLQEPAQSLVPFVTSKLFWNFIITPNLDSSSVGVFLLVAGLEIFNYISAPESGPRGPKGLESFAGRFSVPDFLLKPRIFQTNNKVFNLSNSGTRLNRRQFQSPRDKGFQDQKDTKNAGLRPPGRPNLSQLNSWKIGFLLGLFVDAFKVGS